MWKEFRGFITKGNLLQLAPAIYYGAFINNLVNFLLIAFVVFLLVKDCQRMQKPEEVGPPTTKDCPFGKTTISIAATRCPNCTSELGT